MENPWKQSYELGAKILKEDECEIKRYNETKRSDRYKLNTDYFPHPYLGDPKAPFYLLLGNPGRGFSYDPKNDIGYCDKLSKEKEQLESKSDYYQERVLRNLHHENDYDLKNMHLDKKFEGDSGFKWWTDCFNDLVRDSNLSLARLTELFFVVELYGYHSFNTDNNIFEKPNSITLESSEYNFKLVRQAINEGKFILMSRSISTWFKKVPELRKHDKCLFLNINRKVKLSRHSIPPIAYKHLIRYKD